MTGDETTGSSSRAPRIVAFLTVATVTAFSLAVAPEARAGSPDPMFDFTFSIGPDTGYGSVDVVSLGGGEYNATDGSLTVTGGNDIGTYTLLPGGPAPYTCSPDNCEFGADNDIFPAGTPPIDQYGLVFTLGDILVTLTAPGASNYYFATYSPEQGLYLENDTSGNAYVSFSPEPGSSTLLGSALVGLCVIQYRKLARRQRRIAVVSSTP